MRNNWDDDQVQNGGSNDAGVARIQQASCRSWRSNAVEGKLLKEKTGLAMAVEGFRCLNARIPRSNASGAADSIGSEGVS